MRHMDIRGIGRTLGLLIAVGLVFGATAMAQDAMPSGEPGFLVDGEQLELLVTGQRSRYRIYRGRCSQL